MDNKTQIVPMNSQNNDIDSKKDLIKRLYCKGSTDDELELFIHACKRVGLDPFMKQIYAIKRGNALTIQTAIDGFRVIAERTGCYSPGRESTFTYDEKEKVLSATSYIKKMTLDKTWHEIAATAYMEEYDGKNTFWNKMPRTMLSKCAEALALRKAFPAQLSGLYTKEEMDQAGEEKNLEQDFKGAVAILGEWKKIMEYVQDRVVNTDKSENQIMEAAIKHPARFASGFETWSKKSVVEENVEENLTES